MSRAAAGKPLCFVQVGLESLIMPAADANKLMALLASAVACERDWPSGLRSERYIVKDRPLKVSIETIHPSQVDMPPGASPEPTARPKRRLLTGGGL